MFFECCIFCVTPVVVSVRQKLHGDLQQQQATIERIKYLAQEILMACHPNAVRFVKYYLTITQTRWEQVRFDSGETVNLFLALSSCNITIIT